MMPIVFATIAESMVMQQPQLDLGVLIGAGALVVSAITFYISYTRESQSEQIKTSRDMWARIDVKFDKIRETAKTKGWDQSENAIKAVDVPADIVWPVVSEIDYFAYLILRGEIKDKVVLGYYKTPLSQYIISILKYYTYADERHFLYEDYRNFDKLITEWKIDRPDEEKT